MEVWGEEKIPWPIAMWESVLDKVDLVSDFIGKRKILSFENKSNFE
jgi:hypothetical protein